MDNYNFPDQNGHFGPYGGTFVAETLIEALDELKEMYNQFKDDKEFLNEFHHDLKHFVGRPSPIYFAERLTHKIGGAKIYFKREDLNHTGAHKVNNTVGQALLAKKMGKPRVIAETGAGQHGVATATACALFGYECEVFMGASDIERQKPNVQRMHLLGAKIHPVTSGKGTLKDAMNDALRYWVSNANTHFYIIGTVAGPHPYPRMVRDFQSIIGEETKKQILEKEGKLPNALIACIGGGSNAIGLFHPFLDDKDVELFGVEAAGKGLNSGEHASSINKGKVGILHGNKTYLLQDKFGQIEDAHSISAGLDYPGIGPEHSWLNDIGRVKYLTATDKDSLRAFQLCSKLEGIIPALEPSHALHVTGVIEKKRIGQVLVMNMCGRGDKDLPTIMPILDKKI